MRRDLSFNALLQSHYRAMRRKMEAIADAERTAPAPADASAEADADPAPGGRPASAMPGSPDHVAPAGDAPQPPMPTQAEAGARAVRPPLTDDLTIDASTRDLLDRIGRR